jgi:hypothetical protein
MTDFESAIRESISSGLSIDEIAKQFTNSINKIVEETSLNDERSKYLQSLTDSFHEKYQANKLDYSSSANIAILVAAKTHPNWTAQDMQKKHKLIKGYLESFDFDNKLLDSILDVWY